MDLRFRKMLTGDLPQVIEIENALFSDKWSANIFIDELSNEFTNYYVAETEDKIVGYAGFWLICDMADITNIAVSGKYQRQGIGLFLLEKVIEKAYNKGAVEIALEVRMGNKAAIALYEKKGFNVMGVRNGYYTAPREDALVMVKRRM